MNKQMKKHSKFLSLLLRHRPEAIGLELDENGWALIEDLINKTQDQDTPLTHEIIREVTDTNEKKRFAISDDGLLIRANQGHSIDVDVELEEAVPPDVLKHGTGEKNVQSILKQGLSKQQRHHVHLSVDAETATQVGGRHGKPHIFTIDAKRMHEDGIKFFVSKNGVWLTDYVDPKYIQ